jgi:hypothetical protein
MKIFMMKLRNGKIYGGTGFLMLFYVKRESPYLYLTVVFYLH